MQLDWAKKLVLGSTLLCSACIVPPPPPPATAFVPPQTAAAPPPNCREYNAEVMIGGQPQPAFGMACQQPDGSWQITQEAQGQQQPQVYVVPANPAVPWGYPYWAYDPFWGPRVAIGGTFVFGGDRGFRGRRDFFRDRGFRGRRW